MSASQLIALCRARGLLIATAESCTGGLLAAAITAVPGSSDVFERGFVTYSNAAKSGMLGVPEALISAEGAVSEAVARAMAEGALRHSAAHVSAAITGIAGPGGGSPAKPVGLVHFAIATRGAATTHLRKEFGDAGRDKVRRLSVETALGMMLRAIGR